MLKKFVLPAIITLILGAVNYYLALPALHIKSVSFWAFILFLIVVFVVSHLLLVGSIKIISIFRGVTPTKRFNKKEGEGFSVKKWHKTVIISVVAAIILVFGAIFVSSTPVFNASKYQKMLTVTEADFSKDIAEIPLSQIPVVDRDTATRLGSRKIGEVVELVSQFNVSSYYTQINYNQVPVRVSPLEYADFLKWFVNKQEGIPYYVKIDMATQDTELVELKKGMRYSPGEYFARDLMRHVRFSYPTKMFEHTSFEIDDSGNPYWIISYYDYTIGFLGGKDIAGIIAVNAVTGEMKDYPVSDVPQWIDAVYSADMIIEQADYWGAYKNGFFNSIFTQKNVVATTDGYNYLAINDDVWLYTGITSVVDDESNIGFILVNLRTKQAKTFAINGAEEYSAMESAEGMIQEKGYNATFPILVNIADTPSYFISLKDDAGLVKAYSFVSVSNYQIVGVADTLAGAQNEYIRLLKDSGKINEDTKLPTEEEIKTASGKIEKISSAVVNGNSRYYIKIAGNETAFVADISLSDKLPLIGEGETITISYYTDEKGNITVTQID